MRSPIFAKLLRHACRGVRREDLVSLATQARLASTNVSYRGSYVIFYNVVRFINEIDKDSQIIRRAGFSPPEGTGHGAVIVIVIVIACCSLPYNNSVWSYALTLWNVDAACDAEQ